MAQFRQESNVPLRGTATWSLNYGLEVEKHNIDIDQADANYYDEAMKSANSFKDHSDASIKSTGKEYIL